MQTPSWIQKNKAAVFIAAVVFVIYVASSFDVCNYPSQPEPSDKGFIFSASWNPEHLHTSECYAVYYQTQAFSEGRTWITQGVQPDLSIDCIEINGKYYQIAEPITAALLVPFYSAGNLLGGDSILIRSVMIGMMVFTVISALLIRKISLILNQTETTAITAAFIFAFATMAFSYAKLLYPQPVTAMLMLAAIFFMLSYKSSRKLRSLFFFAFFYALTVFSFNAFVITLPFFLFYLYRIGLPQLKKSIYTLLLGVLPILILFLSWNSTTTGNPLVTPRQIEHQSITFDLVYSDPSGTWLNLQGIVGSLFSPVGIFFVSPLLLAAFATFKGFTDIAKKEAFLFLAVIISFWLFMSWANLGGSIQRDFWVGGWANIARYMYIPSTLLVILAAPVFTEVGKRSLIGSWLVSVVAMVSVLANLSYSIRHDLMVGFIKDVKSTSLLVWPSQIDATELGVISTVAALASFVYPAYLYLNKQTPQKTNK